MKVVCSYCEEDLGEKEPLSDTGVSHGMCDLCYEYFNRQWSGLKLGEYLDCFEQPVLVIEEGGRIIAANQAMSTLLGKDDRSLFGLLGGEAMECQYSRLPGGCGSTIHCQTCTIRDTVMQSLATGEPLEQVPASLDRTNSTISYLISAYPRASYVEVIIVQVDTEPTP